MSALSLLFFTVFPGVVLAVVGGLSVWRVRRTGEYRLFLLAGFLMFMLSHQMLEARTFLLSGVPAEGLPEWIETTANTLAAVAVHYATDIFVDERRLRTDLAKSERRYRTLMDDSPLPILVHEGGAVSYANEAMAGLLAADSTDALTGRPLSEVLNTGGGRDVTARIASLTEDAEGSFVELDVVDFEGRDRSVFVSGARTDEGDSRRTHLVFRDVTKEREFQHELEQTRGRLDTTLKSSNDAIFLIDPDEPEIIDANPRAAEMLRYDRDGLVGLSPFEIHPHEDTKFDEFLESVARDGAVVTDELSCLRRDGVEVPAEISASLTTVDDRECVLAAVRNISERKRRQQQIEVLERVLRHNLRNDMTVVLGQSEVIESRTDNGTIAEAATTVREKARSLVGLSEQVRRLQSTIRSESGETRAVDLEPVVADVAAEFRDRYPGAEITVDVPGETTVEEAAPEPLAWALSNLVENAIEHAERVDPTVEITVDEATDYRGDWIDISVRDECPEIAPEERRIVTEPTEVTKLSHGTGIGLWVVSHVVDTFDGDIAFDRRDDDRGNVVSLCFRGTTERETRVQQ